MRWQLLRNALCPLPFARSHRQLNNKFRTPRNVILDTDNPIMVGNNRTDNGKSQSHAGFFCFVSFAVSHDPILKRIRLEAADSGSGISNEDKTRLFEPNFSTKKSGMGLGLTIVSTIIADHNGVISVQDNIPRGAKFVIELPV